VFLGPITDRETRDYVVSLLGAESDGDEHKASAAGLQQLNGQRALVVRGASLPALVSCESRLPPILRRRARRP
jgi:hypothetical protein